MTVGATEPAQDALGPIDFIVVEFPDGVVTSGGFEQLLELADRGVVRVLDVEFVVKDADGVRAAEISELACDPGLDAALWHGASSHLLDDEDRSAIGAEMAEGSVAVAVVFENLWVLGLVEQWSATGARLLLDGAIPVADLLDALDASETA
jgi:hypothetical protein